MLWDKIVFGVEDGNIKLLFDITAAVPKLEEEPSDFWEGDVFMDGHSSSSCSSNISSPGSY